MVLEHITKERPQHLFDNFYALWRNEQLCDISLQTNDGPPQKAHKLILAASSPYFKAMFTMNMEEKSLPTVTIQEISNRALELLLEYCYTSRIVVDEHNVQELLTAACLLHMEGVQEACCTFLKAQIDSNNCLGFSAFADTLSCRELVQAADEFAKKHYLEVLNSDEFLDLSYAQLCNLLQSDELYVEGEEQVYESLMKWISFRSDDRKKHLTDLLEHVRLPLVTPSFLVNVVGTNQLIKSEESCRDLVDEAKNYLLLPEQRAKLEGPRTRPRNPIRYGEMIYSVGGWCSGDAIATVERYNAMKDEWEVVEPMSKRRCGVGVGVVDDCLYAVGGHDGNSYLNSVERFDPKFPPDTSPWTTIVAPTSTCRTSVGVGVLKKKLYAVGGQDGVSCLSVVERLDPVGGTWEQVAPLNTRRLGVSLAVLADYLYAIGGSDGANPLNSVERFDPITNTWNFVAPMSTSRKHLGAAVLDGHIYAVGGRDDTTELNTVERYNPTTNSWDSVVSMNSRRSGVGLVVANGKLYAVGGFDGSMYLKSVEWLDVSCWQWKFCVSMNNRRLGGGVGVLRHQHLPPISSD